MSALITARSLTGSCAENAKKDVMVWNQHVDSARYTTSTPTMRTLSSRNQSSLRLPSTKPNVSVPVIFLIENLCSPLGSNAMLNKSCKSWTALRLCSQRPKSHPHTMPEMESRRCLVLLEPTQSLLSHLRTRTSHKFWSSQSRRSIVTSTPCIKLRDWIFPSQTIWNREWQIRICHSRYIQYAILYSLPRITLRCRG